jgi:hypothetical protein
VAESILLKPKKKLSPWRYFFGAFPVPLRLLKIHLHCLIRLRRLLYIPLSHRSYNANGFLKGPRLSRYLAIVAIWRNHAPAGIHTVMDLVDQLHNPLDPGTSSGGSSPAMLKKSGIFWNSTSQRLKKCCKQKYRSLRSSSIRDAVLKREKRLHTNIMRMALAFLLSKQKQSFLYDTLHCADGSYDADPVEVNPGPLPEALFSGPGVPDSATQP